MNQRLLTVVALLVVSGSVLGRPKEDVEPKQTQESRYDMDYVPIASSNNSAVKKWPGGEGNIDSLDDLMLYHIYTNKFNENSLGSRPGSNYYQAPPVTESPYHYLNPTEPYDRYPLPTYSSLNNNPYTNPPKPSIIIIEALTSKPSYYDTIYDSYNEPSFSPTKPNPVYSDVLQVFDKPDTSTVNYVPVYLGATQKPMFPQNDEYTTEEPFPNVPNTPISTTTKRPKKKKPKPNCPTVNINTFSSINNANDINSKCSDVTVNVDTQLSNTNSVKPSSQNTQTTQVLHLADAPPSFPQTVPPTANPGLFIPNRPIITHFLNKPYPKPVTVFVSSATTAAPVLSDEYSPSSGGSTSPTVTPVSFFSDTMSMLYDRFTHLSMWNILTLPFFTTVVAPLTIMLAGGVAIGAMMFPWAFPFFGRRSSTRNKFIILRNRSDPPTKYLYRKVGDDANYLKRARRHLFKEFPIVPHKVNSSDIIKVDWSLVKSDLKYITHSSSKRKKRTIIIR